MQDKTNKPVVFSALEVANICGVVNQTAINWIKGGHLKAFTTPGGQYRVYPDDLAEFMKERDMRIPDELAKHCTGVTVAKKSILVVDDDRGLNTVITSYSTNKNTITIICIYWHWVLIILYIILHNNSRRILKRFYQVVNLIVFFKLYINRL